MSTADSGLAHMHGSGGLALRAANADLGMPGSLRHQTVRVDTDDRGIGAGGFAARSTGYDEALGLARALDANIGWLDKNRPLCERNG